MGASAGSPSGADGGADRHDARIRLRTLGTLALASPDGALDARLPPGGRNLALLAYLALSGRPCTRDHLAALFWGRVDGDRARHSLRNALSALRRRMGDGVLATRGEIVAFAPDGPVAVDALAVRTAAAAGDAARALALYAGPFLDGVYVAGAPELEAWIAAERDALGRAVREACARACDAAERADDWAASERVARGWLALAPTDAGGVLALMRALAAPDTPVALRAAVDVGQAYAGRLTREFALAPDPAVTRLGERLARRIASRPPGIGESAPMPRPTAADAGTYAAPPAMGAALVTVAPVATEPVVAAPVGTPPPPGASRRATPAGVSRWAGRALAVGALALAIVGGWMGRPTAPAPAAGPTSLAVLPFEHQGDSADAYLADGLVDDIRGRLTGVPGLVVIARASSLRYRSAREAPEAIARALGVRWLLTGTVRIVGHGAARRVLVRPELVEIAGDSAPRSRWQRPFDVAAGDVARAQADVAGAVVGAMALVVGDEDQVRLASVVTTDGPAYDLYLRGQAAWNRGLGGDPLSLQRASALFEQALARDSTLVEAWSALALAQSQLYFSFRQNPTTAARARAAADRARALAPGSAPALRAQAAYRRLVTTDNAGVVTALAGADAVVGDAALLTLLASAEADLGRLDDALRVLDRAGRLDPLEATVHGARARVLLRLERVPEARTAAARMRALAPAALPAVALQVSVELAAGDLGAARRIVAEAAQDIPRERLLGFMAGVNALGWVLDANDARAALALGPAPFGDVAVMHAVHAELHAWRGDTASARAEARAALAAAGPRLREAPGTPPSALLHFVAGMMHAFTGNRVEADRALTRGLALADARPENRRSQSAAFLQYMGASVALAAGDRERALALLAESRRRHHVASPAWVRLDPAFAALRGDPRFEAALRSR